MSCKLTILKKKKKKEYPCNYHPGQEDCTFPSTPEHPPCASSKPHPPLYSQKHSLSRLLYSLRSLSFFIVSVPQVCP